MSRTVPAPGRHEDVLEHVGPGTDVILPLANGEPVGLIDTLEEHEGALERVRVHQMHALHERPYLRGAFGDRLRHVSYFLSGATRQAFWDGSCDLVPNHFSEMPQLLMQSLERPLVLAAASPPDRHGYFSLGTNADYAAALIGRVPFFLEVNDRMPRTFGLNQVHASEVVGWCEASRPLVEVIPAQPDERDRAIAAAIVEHIPDRATLQVGIGGIPNALLEALRYHRGLGIHTELLADGIVELVECGAVTGTHKLLRRNKLEATFCLGTQQLYDWLHDNSAVELLPVDLVNDPRRIAVENDFISINATTEVDLYGQCARHSSIRGTRSRSAVWCGAAPSDDTGHDAPRHRRHRYGATLEIAQAIAAGLARRGLEAEARPVEELAGLEGYDAFVVGSAVYVGRWLEPARELVEAHGGTLRERPVWLFSSGPLGPPDALKPEGDPVDAAAMVEASGAIEHRVFAGRLDRSLLSFGEKAVVIAVRAPEGDFRDWDEIDGFAAGIADHLKRG